MWRSWIPTRAPERQWSRDWDPPYEGSHGQEAKYKARFLVCRSMAVEPCAEHTSVGGICTVALRCMVHRAALSVELGEHRCGRSLFLQAPRRGEKVTLVEPPTILRQLGLCGYGEKWRVRCALYGFTESPADWGHFRDRTLKSLTWSVEGQRYGVVPTGEPHLWKMIPMDQEGLPACDYVAIYVDNVLAAADQKILASFSQAVKQEMRMAKTATTSARRAMCEIYWWEGQQREMSLSLCRRLRVHYRSEMPEEQKDIMIVATDASFAPEHEQFRSVTGVVIHHGSNTLQWVSMRQPFVTHLWSGAHRVCGRISGWQEHWSVDGADGLGAAARVKLVGDNKAAL